MTAITLFAVGAARTFVTGLGVFRSGLEMLAVGSLAAVAAYVIGAFVAGLTN
jgi:VIT1/CCC1 family predicted Fe2+/Mn2+ transporter